MSGLEQSLYELGSRLEVLRRNPDWDYFDSVVVARTALSRYTARYAQLDPNDDRRDLIKTIYSFVRVMELLGESEVSTIYSIVFSAYFEDLLRQFGIIR
jgi:hypothetical protein